jgi:cell division protein FtsW (lipid II flippase)
MISPVIATIIMVSFILVFGVGVPILDRKAPKYISYRWCVIVVALALLIGAVIDFEVLSDDARKIVLVGGLVIAGVYVVLRTIEKVLANGWLKGASIEATKGDISVKLSSDSKDGEKKDG